MDNRRMTGFLSLLAAAGILLGCRQTEEKLHYLGDANLNYYRDVATTLDYPAVHSESADVIAQTQQPRTVQNLDKDDIWDLTLPETIQIALESNEVIRTRGQFLSPGNTLLANPDFQPSIYDPAIQQTGVLFGQRGVEAALADFDTQFTTTMLWGRNEQVSNSRFTTGLEEGQILVEDTANFTSQLSKPFATGGRFTVSHNWNYSSNNVANRLFGSAYQGFVRAEYRQPLWAGAGVEFTRIAGPISENIQGISGVNQGVLIARINTDISLADFEAGVRNMVRDVEAAYWDLFQAYHVYDAEVVARDSALKIWQLVKARPETGAAEEAQARDNYFETQSRTREALNRLYAVEAELRLLMGLPANDGRVIRPAEEPVTAAFQADWHISIAEALTDRVELRRQKWNIKSLELQLQAADNLTSPRLDFVSAYQVNGFGDQLFGQNDNDGVTDQGFNSAYETLTQGDQTGWNLGFEFSVPFGLRVAHSQVRNLELRLAKARELLAAQELEISHELANSFRNLDLYYETAYLNFNRRRAAARRVETYEALYEADVRRGQGSESTLDLVLRSQLSLAQADIQYYTSIAEYNKALIDLHFRKGTLLQHNNIHLSEGLWEPEAYIQALQRAWHRSHAFIAKGLETLPHEFVLGPADAVEFVPPQEPPIPDGGHVDGIYTPAPAPTPVTPPAPAPEDEAEPDSEPAPNSEPEKLEGMWTDTSPQYPRSGIGGIQPATGVSSSPLDTLGGNVFPADRSGREVDDMGPEDATYFDP